MEEPKTNKISRISRRNILRGLLAAVVIAVVAWLVAAAANNPAAPAKITPPPVAKVLITEDGFQPASLSVKAGTVVIWDNQDTKPHRVAANPYGSHTTLPSLDSKSNIATNGSYRYKFTQKGTFNYHDELNPQVNGTVIVK